MPAGSVGNRPSTAMDAGTAVNQVGGSMIAVSCDGADPVTGLAAPPVFSQFTMALRPSPDRVAAVSPLVSEPLVRNAAPFAPAPTYPPPDAKNPVSRARATGLAALGQPPVFHTTS